MYKVTVPVPMNNGFFNKEDALKELRRMKADRVSLNVWDSCHKLTEEECKYLKENIEFFEQNGFEVLLWIGESFGHSPEEKDNPNNYELQHLIDKGEIGSYCPLGKKFIRDFCEYVKQLVKCGAKMIMIDDDFRLGYRGGLACCCDLHMELIEKHLGEKIDRNELRRKIFSGGENKYRDAWLKAQGESMTNLARALRDAINEIDPSVRLGRCCSLNSWDSDGNDAIDLSYTLAGDTKPFIRLSGAPYWCCRDRYHRLGTLIEYVRMQIDWCRDKGIEVFTEGDTWPRPRFGCPASFVECFDTALRADGGTDGILKYTFDYISDVEYERGYVDASEKNEELYKKVGKLFDGKKAVGVRPYNVMHLIKTAEYDCEKENLLNEIQDGVFSDEVRFAAENSLPISYDKGGINIVFGENARHIPLEDLKYGNVVDISAVKILRERGVDTGITDVELDDQQKISSFYDGCEYFIEENRNTKLLGAVEIPNLKSSDDAIIHTKFGDKNGIIEYTNKNGERFLVLPFVAAQVKNENIGFFKNYSLRRLLVKYANKEKNNVLAWCGDNYPELYIMTQVKEDRVAVGLWNLFDDAIDNAKIDIGVPFDEVEFVNCTGHFENNRIVLDKTLYPYEFAGFELKVKGN